MHTATALSDGRVLVAGGQRLADDQFVAAAQVFDPRTESWSAAPSLPRPTGSSDGPHPAVELDRGGVLALGLGEGNVGDSAQVYRDGAWAQVADPPRPHGAQSTATALANGDALVVGGIANLGTAAADLYRQDGTWAAAGVLEFLRRAHTATRLQTGQVLVTGGWSYDVASTNSATAELYDPPSGRWRVVGNMTAKRIYHTATLLRSGKVLVTGGVQGLDEAMLASAELYDPGTGQWEVTAPMHAARVRHTATLLPNGKVLVVGSDGKGSTLPADLYDPAANTWTEIPAPIVPVTAHTATLLEGSYSQCGANCGKVLIAGPALPGDPSAELYTPTQEVTKVSPASVPANGSSTITAEGTGMAGATSVSVGGVDVACGAPGSGAACEVDATNPDTMLRVIIQGPGGAEDTTVDLVVTTAAGGRSAACDACRLTFLAAPGIGGVTPTDGPVTGGTAVTMTGTGLAGATGVSFGDALAAPTSVNADGTSLTVASPRHSSGPGPVALAVETPARGRSEPSGQFVYHPALTGMFPTSGETGRETMVTISGQGLSGTSSVRFGDSEASGFTVRSDDEIVATAPRGDTAGAVPVTLVAAGIGSMAVPDGANLFTYVMGTPVLEGPPPGGPGPAPTDSSTSGEPPPPVPPGGSSSGAPTPGPASAASPAPASAAAPIPSPAATPTPAPNPGTGVAPAPPGVVVQGPAPGPAAAGSPGIPPSPGQSATPGSAWGGQADSPQGAERYAMVGRARDDPLSPAALAVMVAWASMLAACGLGVAASGRRASASRAALSLPSGAPASCRAFVQNI